MKPNIHILGIQGSGKGTQSALLTQKYGFSYISSGDLFRQRSKEQDELGMQLHADMQAGKLMSDQQLFDVVESYLERNDAPQGLLGDGVIRTAAQVEGLASIWPKYDLDQPLLIHFQLSEEVALSRIENRKQELLAKGEKVRADDNPEGIKIRFKLFHDLTEPVVQSFIDASRCIEISADQSVETIHTEVCRRIEAVYPELTHVAN